MRCLVCRAHSLQEWHRHRELVLALAKPMLHFLVEQVDRLRMRLSGQLHIGRAGSEKGETGCQGREEAYFRVDDVAVVADVRRTEAAHEPVTTASCRINGRELVLRRKPGTHTSDGGTRTGGVEDRTAHADVRRLLAQEGRNVVRELAPAPVHSLS